MIPEGLYGFCALPVRSAVFGPAAPAPTETLACLLPGLLPDGWNRTVTTQVAFGARLVTEVPQLDSPAGKMN
jgi:hypothetical protein